MSSQDKVIMCVGLVCADIINTCNKYPVEDSDQRIADQRWHRGGNAANSCTVLALLGAQVECLACLAVSPELAFLQADFQDYGIITDHCVYHEGCSTPMSVVILNRQNGSRTILHSNKNLPEVTFEDFKKVDLTSNKYKWIHFEGRPTVIEMKQMLQHINQYNSTVDKAHRITTSVELEKQRPELEELTNSADYVFISKEHAQFSGFNNKEETVENFIERCHPGATVICAWGEEGAIARTWNGQIFSSPIFPPEQIIDTLGAGDTFNAAVILALSNRQRLDEALTFGCQVAGAKCGMVGFGKLKEWYQSYSR